MDVSYFNVLKYIPVVNNADSFDSVNICRHAFQEF